MTPNIALAGLDVCAMTTGWPTDQDFPVCVVNVWFPVAMVMLVVLVPAVPGALTAVVAAVNAV